MGRKNAGIKTVCENRKARHAYFIHETYEAGIALQGTEVKSLRAGRANLKDSYASIQNGEIFVENLHIRPYDQGNIFNHDPLRTRKLLLHKKQIKYLIEETKTTGVTLVPLKVYLKNGVAKVLIGLAKGKKSYDKRDALKQKDMKREIDRAMKER